MGINLPRMSFTTSQNDDNCLQTVQSWVSLQRPVGSRTGYSEAQEDLCCCSPGIPILLGQENSASCGFVEEKGKYVRARAGRFYQRHFLSSGEHWLPWSCFLKNTEQLLLHSTLLLHLFSSEIQLQWKVCAAHTRVFSLLGKWFLADFKRFCFQNVAGGYTSKTLGLNLCKYPRIRNSKPSMLQVLGYDSLSYNIVLFY